ncbi:MAG: hypothetical protein JXA28_01885, partial [Bacteroidetes bacterium]|nr:hypothetical protein [Bacteroidota bacterium]
MRILPVDRARSVHPFMTTGLSMPIRLRILAVDRARSVHPFMTTGLSMPIRPLISFLLIIAALPAFVVPAIAQETEVVRNDVYHFEVRDVDGSPVFTVHGIAPYLQSEVRIPRRILRFRMPAAAMYDVVLRESVLTEPFDASPFYRVEYDLAEDSALIPRVVTAEAAASVLQGGGEVRILDRRWRRVGEEVELEVEVPLLTWDPVRGQTRWVTEYRFTRVQPDGMTAPLAQEGKPRYSSMPFTTRSRNVDTSQAWIDYQNPMVKFFISEDGLYRIDADWLRASGVDPAGVDPGVVQLYRKGVPVSMYAQGMADGSFDDGDAFIFHATRNYVEGGYRFIPDDWRDPYPEYMSIYTDSTAYWLHFSTPNPLRTGEAPFMSPLPADTVDWAYETAHVEVEAGLRYFHPEAIFNQIPHFNTQKTWFWTRLNTNATLTPTFDADNVKAGKTARAWAKALHWYATRTIGWVHSVTLRVNGSGTLDSVLFASGEQGLASGSLPSDSIKEGKNLIYVSAHDIGDPQSVRLLDWADTDYPRRLVVGERQHHFSYDSAMGTGTRLLKFFNVT